MIKNIVFPVLLTLVASSASWASLAPVVTIDSEMQAALDHHTALIKTPSEEDIKYAPEAAEALLKATMLTKALERVLTTLPASFSAREEAIASLDQTNSKVASINMIMKKTTKLHGTSSSVTQQELQDRVSTEVVGILKRSELLVELLTTMLPSANKNDAEEMGFKTLQFIADLSTSTSELERKLTKNNADTHSSTKYLSSRKKEYHANAFNIAEIETNLTKDLEMFCSNTSSSDALSAS